MEKKINPDVRHVSCVECGNGDPSLLLLIKDAPWVVECVQCGHPNDRTWDDSMDFIYE